MEPRIVNRDGFRVMGVLVRCTPASADYPEAGGALLLPHDWNSRCGLTGA